MEQQPWAQIRTEVLAVFRIWSVDEILDRRLMWSELVSFFSQRIQVPRVT